jgi:DNA-binding transcriptional regulator YdaS (Cro superfamily)
MNDARDFLAGRSGTELSAIARAAGTSLCHLRNICYGQKRAGPELAIRIERATAGALPRRRLRPDLWSPPAAELRDRPL